MAGRGKVPFPAQLEKSQDLAESTRRNRARLRGPCALCAGVTRPSLPTVLKTSSGDGHRQSFSNLAGLLAVYCTVWRMLRCPR
jgi:hypothetical protein